MNVKIDRIPEEKLTPRQRTHLKVAREVAGEVPVIAAKLSDHLHIIGAYDTLGSKIYITPERLERLSTTLNTGIHELAHHQTHRDDGTREHSEAISRISKKVTAEAGWGKYDGLLRDAIW